MLQLQCKYPRKTEYLTLKIILTVFLYVLYVFCLSYCVESDLPRYSLSIKDKAIFHFSKIFYLILIQVQGNKRTWIYLTGRGNEAVKVYFLDPLSSWTCK